MVTLAHGAGGKASAALLDAVFLPASRTTPAALTDAAVLALPSGERLAFTTDSFVVKPLLFPGGSVGHLAVHGTVNDLAMMGARPLALSAAFVLEEGFPDRLAPPVVADMAEAAADGGVPVVTGDTKVVDHGAADGMYISTSGVGLIPAGRQLWPPPTWPGRRRPVSRAPSATTASRCMLARGDLALDADIVSDTAPLHRLMECLLAAAPVDPVAARRHPGRRRHGLQRAGARRNLTVVLEESALPVRPAVAAACELLGIDPLYVANEGKLVAVVGPDEAEAALAALRGPLGGRDARDRRDRRRSPRASWCSSPPLGGTRIVDMLVGDPLPRIC